MQAAECTALCIVLLGVNLHLGLRPCVDGIYMEASCIVAAAACIIGLLRPITCVRIATAY